MTGLLAEKGLGGVSETRMLPESSTGGYCFRCIQLFMMLERLAEIRKGDYTTFSLLLHQCSWPLDSLQGPEEGLGYPGSVCVVCLSARSVRSTSDTKVGTAWCNKTGLSVGFFFVFFCFFFLDYILFIRSSISKRSGLDLPQAAVVSTAVTVL